MINANVGSGSPTFENQYSNEFELVFKIARSAIRKVQSSNPLQFIDKGTVENGVIIEDAIVKLAESYAFN